MIAVMGFHGPSGGGGASFPASLGANLVLDFTNLSLANLYTDTGATTNLTADGQTCKAIKDPTSGVIATNSTGWVYHANSGKPYLAADGSTAFSIPSITFADATGQYAIWATVNLSSASATMELLTDGSGHLLVGPNATSGAMNFIIKDTSGTQLGSAWSAGVTVSTDQVYAGISKGTSGTSGTAEAFVNGVDTPGSGVVAWSGTPAITRSFKINPSTTVAGKFYGLLMANGDQTANLSAAQTYMAGLHP